MKGLLKAEVMLNCNANVIPQLSNWGKCQLLEGEDLSRSPFVWFLIVCEPPRTSPRGPRSQVSARAGSRKTLSLLSYWFGVCLYSLKLVQQYDNKPKLLPFGGRVRPGAVDIMHLDAFL